MTDQAYSVEQFISAFKLGRTTVYQQIAAGRLQTYRVGRRRFISAQAAATWQAGLEDEAKQATKEGAGVAA